MNYYRRYPGDYARDTAHLTLSEHGVYTLLLDHQYATEKALPASIDALYRICSARTPEDEASVKSVAEQFFPVNGHGRINPRAGRQLPDEVARISAARGNGSVGGYAKWGSQDPNKLKRSERLANARRLGRHSVGDWQALQAFHDHKCAKCGAEDVIKDHIIPIYQGSSDAIENIQPLCRKCNSAKGPDRTDYRKSGWQNACQNACPPSPSPSPSLRSSLPTSSDQNKSLQEKDHSSVSKNGHECFEEFWKRYPRKEGKKRALEVWLRKKLESRERATPIIVDVVKRSRDHQPWRDGFIPHASTYLNGERWQDDIKEVAHG